MRMIQIGTSLMKWLLFQINRLHGTNEPSTDNTDKEATTLAVADPSTLKFCMHSSITIGESNITSGTKLDTYRLIPDKVWNNYQHWFSICYTCVNWGDIVSKIIKIQSDVR
jgi:hypothetical protein